jgi:hypothetical protein
VKERRLKRAGILLKGILKKDNGRLWTGFIWLRIGNTGGML